MFDELVEVGLSYYVDSNHLSILPQIVAAEALARILSACGANEISDQNLERGRR